MKIPNPYKLHVSIRLEKTSEAQAGKAIGMLCRDNVKMRQVGCTVERINDTAISMKAETVITKLLVLPSPWERSMGCNPTKTILLDDRKASQLAKRWDSMDTLDSLIVVPHVFYLSLLTCFIRNLEILSPEILGHLCIFLGYTEHVQASGPDIISRSFLGERGEVLKYLRRMGLTFIDPGHQLLVENQISLACYMIPAKRLIFMDDDFFIDNIDTIEKLDAPLKLGYLLSGIYTKHMDKIHTCLFALNPGYLRNELGLFDDGENLYYDNSRDTGTNTYRLLSKRDKGVFILGESPDGNGLFGRHLGHCAAELWFDLPAILKKRFRLEMISADRYLNVSTLLGGLALLLKANDWSDRYCPVQNDLRINAQNDFSAYYSNVYHNHLWLEQQARSFSPKIY